MITGRQQVATIRPGETVDRIHGVEFYSLNRSRWDGFGPAHYSQIPGEYDYDGERIVAEGGEIEHPCAQLKKLLSGGSFFFSTDCDLTNRLQHRFQLPSLYQTYEPGVLTRLLIYRLLNITSYGILICYHHSFLFANISPIKIVLLLTQVIFLLLSYEVMPPAHPVKSIRRPQQ